MFTFCKFRLDLSTGFDYRWERYPGTPSEHPADSSLKTFTGHKVLRTLIRCHFSPDSTSQRYVYVPQFCIKATGGCFIKMLFLSCSYTGSSDGQVFIFDAERSNYNEPVSVLKPPRKPRQQPENDFYRFFRRGSDGVCTRDVSWHPHLPMLGKFATICLTNLANYCGYAIHLVSSTWLGEEGGLCIYKH
jgi:WD repeat-containing protein 23